MAQSWAKAFYASKQWQAVRQEVMRRQHYCCANCYERIEEVHHVIPLTPKNINDYNIALNPDNLLGLCKSCHSKITDGYTGDVREEYIFNEQGQVEKR